MLAAQFLEYTGRGGEPFGGAGAQPQRRRRRRIQPLENLLVVSDVQYAVGVLKFVCFYRVTRQLGNYILLTLIW